MSKNPYFTHLPTWRNRQDLAYALDNLPRILETMTASSPLIATYSYPSTSSSISTPSAVSSSASSPSASPSSTLNSSSGLPISSTHSQSHSQYGASSSYTSSGRASPSAFRERFMLDVAKECHKTQSRSPDSTAQNTIYPSRRISNSSVHSQTGSISNTTSHNHGTHNNGTDNTNSYYPMQFSTRAKAMAYLIEILQSLQKEPCGCDLIKGCYCGVDGVEDHEDKSPCYVCGEWFPDRRENSAGVGDQAQTSQQSMQTQSQASQGLEQQQQQQQGQGGQYGQRQGRAWHEQGSLRHHVAESRVKKWLDSVFRPPLTPATSPEQENVRQFAVSQDFSRQGRNHQQQQQQQLTPDYHYYQIQQQLQLQLQQQQQQQQYQQYQQQPMEPGRPWSFHDIELEARSKSRSRQNSSSSNSSISWTLNSNSSPQYQSMSGSGSWKATASPKPSHATPPVPPTQPWTQPPPPPSTSQPASTATLGALYQPRTRTQSCSDSQQDRIHPSSFMAFTPPTVRPSSCNSSRKSTPIRSSSNHSTTFAIPQEILDPNYKSPTFRIKSWNPPTSQSSSPALLPTQGPQRQRQPVIEKNILPHLLKKPSFDDWICNREQPETVTKSLFIKDHQYEGDDRHDDDVIGSISIVGPQQHQGNTYESPVSRWEKEEEEEVKASPKAFNAPFRFSFTSQRFRAAVAASIEKTAVTASVEKSAVTASIEKSAVTASIEKSAVTASIEKSAVASPDIDATEESQFDDFTPTVTSIPQSATAYPDLKASILPVVAITTATKLELDHLQNITTTVITTTVIVEKDSQKELHRRHHYSNDMNATIVATSTPLDSKISDLNLGDTCYPPSPTSIDIRKSAPLSPLHHQHRHHPISGNDTLGGTLSPSSTGSSPNLSTSSPNSPLSLTGMIGGTGTGAGINKAASWTSLHRLVRKMTRNNDQLPRTGRMYLEGTINS